MTINSEQIQALKAAAQLIAHGYQQEWGTERDEDGESTWVGTYDHDGVLCPFIDVSISEWSGEDGDDARLADFIAKANPVAILAMLAERDADKKRIAELEHNHRVHAARLLAERGQLKDRIAELEAISAAAEKLVRCKGRYHSEQNYRAMASLFGVTTPDLPPLEMEARTVSVKLPEPIGPEAAPAHYWDNGESMAYADGYNKATSDTKNLCAAAGITLDVGE
ncbi:TPA: hypothetical protein I8271_004655 [Kluyvera intermedia]|uniref:Ead/Ea22-like family protein n=1 Tax=Kluyvera intermedia TaxID=61648 RepID=A0A9P3TCZ2_KLUIN|nr:ead/Ea22-like family protein [Phytobacter ursingii]HAT2207085.1 hypothetical protein [Kluyvera intermedia]HAT2517777.1 hypothetical protein [Kluyvera intermedia]HAT2605912.1 hypothetical protein [Kluyvera intermedia]HAT2682754.1 hypothetical protein [Kluyvera intermedia]HAT2699224.1 hypothetical protein [Kluyvera intermedia]